MDPFYPALTEALAPLYDSTMHTVALQNKNRVRLHSVSALADRRGRWADANHGRAGRGLTVKPLYLSRVSRANREARVSRLRRR